MLPLVSRIVFHMKGARRASIGSPLSGDIGVDAVDPAQRVREQELGDGRNPVQVHFKRAVVSSTLTGGTITCVVGMSG
jgi:hypothetical protein